MPSNPLTQEEVNSYAINRILNPEGYTGLSPYMPAGYFLSTPPGVTGPALWRLFDASFISTGIIDPNRLGTGATGAGNLYLADDGTWKLISGAPGIGDMLKATYDVDNDGVVDSAETIRIIVRNSTGSTLTKGSVVYLSGATGNRPNAILSQANAESTSSKTIGIVISNIANNSDGYVAVSGTLHDLDTSAFADGVAVWLSPTIAGGLTTTVPSEPNHSVFIGYIARSHPSQGRLVIAIQNGYEINELHDVVAPSPADNDLLRFNSSLGYWQNQTISTIFGGTPLVSVPTLAQVTTAGNTTTNAISVGGLTVNTNLIYTDMVNARVGIGTSSPTRTLTVNGPIVIPNNSGYYTKATSGSELAVFLADTSNNVQIGSVFFGGAQINYTATLFDWYQYPSSVVTHRMRLTAGGNLLIGTTTDAGYMLDVNGTARITSNAIVSGSLGLGTTSPAAKYHQYQTQGIMARYDISNANADQNRGVWDFYTNAATAPDFFGRFGFKFEGGTADSFKQFQINVASSTIPSMVVTGGGLVGIGTIAPAYKLDVRGTTVNDAISTQVGLNFNPVPSPTTGSLALVASAGNVDLGIHYYYVTFTTALGETNPYQIGNITTTSGNQQVTVTIPVSTDSRVTGRKLYRTKASAGGNYWETFNLATIANNTATTYVDNIADASLTGTNGIGFYQVNTTYRALTVNGTQSLVVDLYATYLGVGAGASVTSGGGNNTFIGYQAGRNSVTSNQSVAIGNSALSAQTAGGNNIGIGSQAGGITTGSNNIVIGRNSGANINTGSANTIIGSFTWNLGTVTGKTGNTGLGYRVGSNNTGDYNLFLGNDAGYYVTGSNQILLDTVGRADEATAKSSALIYGVTNATASSQILSLGGGGKVGVGTTSPVYKLEVRGTAAADAIRSFSGFDIYPVPDPSTYPTTTVVAGTALGIGNYYYGVTFVTALGETHLITNAIATVTTSGNQAINLSSIPVSTDSRVTSRRIYRSIVNGQYYNVFLVATIADNTTTTYSDTTPDASLGTLNAFFRVNSTTNNITVGGTKAMSLDSNNVAFGPNAALSLTVGGRITAIGSDAGRNITTGGENVFLGFGAASGVTTGSANTYLGVYTAQTIGSSGTYNVGVGRSALQKITGGSSGNTALGTFSMFENTTAGSNTAVGFEASYSNQTSANIVAIGYQALRTNTAASNTALGYQAGYAGVANTTGVNNIFIGYLATGVSATESHRTWIGNSSTTTTWVGGSLLVGTTTTTGQKLQVVGNVFIKGSDTSSSTKVFEVQTGNGASIMDFRNATYAFFGCGQGGGSNSGFIFNYSNTSYTQFAGYNYGAGSGAYKPILMDTDIAGRGQGIFVNFGVSTNPPPNSDTEFAVLGRTSDATTYISRFRDSSNTDKFAVRADGALFTNTLQGYSGTLTIPTNPPGSNTITITNGLITSIA